MAIHGILVCHEVNQSFLFSFRRLRTFYFVLLPLSFCIRTCQWSPLRSCPKLEIL